MKTLTLLRHAKSGWDDSGTRDFDRPLNPKGQRAAALIGRHVRSLDLAFDQVVASPAARVRQTVDHFLRGYGELPEPLWEKRVYLASAETLLEIVHQLPESGSRALLIGHNPGLEELVLMLVPDRNEERHRGAVEAKFPTASVAELAFDVDLWSDLTPGGARLSRFIRPRDLDPSLGPDQP